MAAIVERNDAAAGARERRHPARTDPVHFLVRGEAVDQHDRLALAFVEESDLHAIMVKTRHRHRPAIRSSAAIPQRKPGAAARGFRLG